MKKLLTILAGALAIVWIAVPVAGAADVYGHAKPADVYASTHPDPYDSVGLRPSDVYSAVHPDPSASSDSLRPSDVYASRHPDPWLSTGHRPHDVYQTSSWNRIHLRQTADVNERG